MNLLLLLDKTNRGMDDEKAVGICSLDFSKAFDSVSHFMLDH